MDILMSTFNGSRFLGEQLDSIIGQTFADFRLVIRDDGSTDNTRDIIREYAAKDERIVIANDELGNLGAARSFMHLVELSSDPLFMLADQDDVWLADKVGSSREKIDEMTARHGGNVPLMVFSDLKVVDENLNGISGSMWQYQRLDPDITADWRMLLAQNVVTGCTIIANRAAAAAALPFALPEMMHDHWLAVNTARRGHIGYLEESTVLYRQHGVNVAGSINYGVGYAAGKMSSPSERYAFYKKAARHFGNVSPLGIAARKLFVNLKRLFR